MKSTKDGSGPGTIPERQPFRDSFLKIYHSIVPQKIDREMRRALSLQHGQFPRTLQLPRKYGRGMTERVVEILIARLTYGPGKKVLDVGHANVMNAHMRMLQSLPAPLDITGVDITPAQEPVVSLYTRSVVENIMETSFHEGSFDLIWCISALEHFGMDNSVYTDRFALDAEMDRKALEEMLRIVRVGGTVYISVPYGKYEDHGWLKNYDNEHWQRLLAAARSVADINELYFMYSDEGGWRVAEARELSHTGYSDHQNAGASGLAVALIHKRT